MTMVNSGLKGLRRIGSQGKEPLFNRSIFRNPSIYSTDRGRGGAQTLVSDAHPFHTF